MNIYKIRESLKLKKGKRFRFKFNGSRNQTEEFNGTIENIYSYIFTIRLDNDKYKIKSFTYSDVLTESLQIFVE